jgi:hypothetical protein
LRRVGAAVDDAVVQGAAPVLVGVEALRLGAAREVVGALALAGEERHQLGVGLAIEHRGDERLHHRGGAVERAQIAPRLERVGARQVPLDGGAGLVAEEREVDALLEAGDQVAELGVGRGVPHRVAAEDDELGDLLVGDGLGQRGDRAGTLGRGVEGLDVAHRAAAGVGGRVDEVRDGVHRRRLLLAGDHDGLALVLAQILDDGADGLLQVGGHVDSGQPVEPDGAAERDRERGHVAAGHAEAVVGHGPGHREAALGGVEAAHAAGGVVGA